MTTAIKLLNTIDKSIEDFIEGLPATQRVLYSRLLELIRELELDRLGKIRNNLANIKKLGSIQKEVEKIVLNEPYLKKVGAFVNTYDSIAQLNNIYFTELNVRFKPKRVLDELKKINITTTVEALTESGIGGTFSNEISNILKRNITSGGSYAELAESLRDSIIGKDGEDGRLVKYSKQIATDAVNQYNAQYVKSVTDDLGLEWYVYQGNNIASTRPFCRALQQKRFFHKSEIPELIQGHVGDKQVPIYDKTGLPHGMIEDTNENNFQVNRGGYNCKHQIFPVSSAIVPKELREQFENVPSD